MTGLNHGITGALIALTIKQPALAVPASFLSHFVCDAIPHWNYLPGKEFTRKFNIILILDFILSVSLMAILGLLFPVEKWLIWSCMIAAAIPDIMWFYYKFYVKKVRHKKISLDPITSFQSKIENSSSNGYWAEAAWFIVVFAIILSLK